MSNNSLVAQIINADLSIIERGFADRDFLLVMAGTSKLESLADKLQTGEFSGVTCAQLQAKCIRIGTLIINRNLSAFESNSVQTALRVLKELADDLENEPA